MPEYKRPKTFEECTERRKYIYETFKLYHFTDVKHRGKQAYGDPEAAGEYNWLASIHASLPHASV